MAGAADRAQPALEALGFFDRGITAARPGWRKAARLLRTPVPSGPRTAGGHVHKKRCEHLLHQLQLAKLIGIGKSTISGWESGRLQAEGRFRNRLIARPGFAFAGFATSSIDQLASLTQNRKLTPRL